MNIKYLGIGFIAVLLMVLLIIGAYIGVLKFNSEEGSKYDFTNKSSESDINPVCSGNVKEFKASLVEPKISPNTKLNLKENNIFVYSITIPGENENFVKYIVERTERYNDKDCYVVGIFPFGSILEQNMSAQQTSYLIYLDRNNGELLKFVIRAFDVKQQKITEIEIKDEMMTELKVALIGGFQFGDLMFTQWMLGLNESFKYKIYGNTTNENKKMGGTIEYNVIGREKIDGRNCFKVEAKILEGNTVSLKKILWIDAEKRVLVKAQTKTPDNLLLMETHLTYTDLWQS